MDSDFLFCYQPPPVRSIIIGYQLRQHAENTPRIHLVPTLQRGNSSGNAPALRNAGASLAAFPRWSVGTIGRGLFIASYLITDHYQLVFFLL